MSEQPEHLALPSYDAEVLAAIERVATVAATSAAREAVKQMFVQLGFNAERASDQIEQQKDNAFVRNLRRSSESRPAKIGMAVFAAFLSVCGALIVLGFQLAFKKVGG